MTTDTTERGLEQRICALLTHRADAPDAADVRERPATYETGWLNGHSDDYDREHCIDLAQLTAFLKATQPHLAAALSLDADSPTRRKFLARLKNEVGKRGIVEVLRNGVKHGPHAIALLYGTPSPGNPQAAALYEQNRFSVTRQLSYSNANKRLTLDLALFINGLPVATFELKNSLTKQTAADAISTVQKFPFILDEIDNDHQSRRFAIVIDEAHSSQGGRTASAMARVLGEHDADDTVEDQINRIIEQRRLLANASYFAFTATPKNKTLELFGAPEPQPDGAIRHRPFHSYAMKQAIQEGFILDVLGHYTPVKSYYRLAKTTADDPEFDANKARKKLIRYVETR